MSVLVQFVNQALGKWTLTFFCCCPYSRTQTKWCDSVNFIYKKINNTKSWITYSFIWWLCVQCTAVGFCSRAKSKLMTLACYFHARFLWVVCGIRFFSVTNLVVKHFFFVGPVSAWQSPHLITNFKQKTNSSSTTGNRFNFLFVGFISKHAKSIQNVNLNVKTKNAACTEGISFQLNKQRVHRVKSVNVCIYNLFVNRLINIIIENDFFFITETWLNAD